MRSLRLVWAAVVACLLALVAGLLLAGRGSAAASTAPRLARPVLPKASAPTLKAVRSSPTVTTVQRTFVSTSGSDSNACTATAPCRSFGAALARTTAGGEVVALTSGGYGPVGIGMSVTIVGAPGVHAAITATSGDAIDVTAGSSETVVLRNLYLNGIGADNGINYTSGKALELENITASGFNTYGVDDQSAGRLYATNLGVHDNQIGIGFSPASGTPPLDLDDARVENNAVQGVAVGANASVRLNDSILSGNAYGVFTDGSAMISGCQLSGNIAAVYVFGGTVQVGGSTVTHNQFGLDNESGTLQSFGDNLVAGNTSVDTYNLTTISKT